MAEQFVRVPMWHEILKECKMTKKKKKTHKEEYLACLDLCILPAKECPVDSFLWKTCDLQKPHSPCLLSQHSGQSHLSARSGEPFFFHKGFQNLPCWAHLPMQTCYSSWSPISHPAPSWLPKHMKQLDFYNSFGKQLATSLMLIMSVLPTTTLQALQSSLAYQENQSVFNISIFMYW